MQRTFPPARRLTTIRAAALIAALATTLPAQTFSFTAPSQYNLPNSPEALATGDFNGDGKPDIAAAIYTGSVSILLSGHGGFHRGATYPVATDVLESIAVADFNGDGKLDIAATAYGAGVAILLGNGDGTFQPPINYAVGPYDIGVAAADFNGDGHPDLAIATGAGIAILLGNGDGTFQAPVNYGTEGYFALTIADFNHDGIPDVAATAGSAVSILLGKGNGTLGPANDIPLSSPYYINSGDLNGDGNPDLAVTTGSGNSVAILLGNGNGTFGPPQSITVTSANAIAIADYNGDGKPDLAVSQPNSVAILFGNGDGTFQAPVDYAVISGPVVTADFNGDHHPDLAVGGSTSGAKDGVVSVLLNQGKGTFPQAPQIPIVTTYGASAFAVADFNHDGKPDLALANTPYVTILLGSGAGAFQTPVNYFANSFTTAIAAGDFNGDGNLDLAVTETGTRTCTYPPCPTTNVIPPGILVFLGNGDGTFQQAPLTPIIGGYPQAVAVGDFNGDGKLDLVIGNGHPANHISILFGNGDGTFQAPIQVNTNGQSVAVAVADFNGDGKADVAVVNKSGSLAVLLGNGDGTFQPPTLYGMSAPVGAPDALVVADFNGDGKPDIAVTKYDPEAIAVLINNGDGTFQLPVNYPADLGLVDWWAGGIVAADFNGDGFEDLASISGSGVAVLAGKGDGTFGPPQFFGPGSGVFLAVGEFAQPGRPALVSSNNSSIALILNTTK